MLNFMKMDFYRVLRQKSTYIMLAIVVGIVIMTAGFTRLEQELLQSEAMPEDTKQLLTATMEKSGEEAVSEDVTGIGMNVNPAYEWMDPEYEILIWDLVEQPVQSGMLAIIVIVFVVVFGFAERRNGYIKNLVGQKHFKSRLWLSKLIVVAFFTTLLFVTLILATMLLGSIIMKNPFSFSLSGATAVKLFAQYLVHLSIGAFTMLIVVIFEGTTVPIVIGTLMCMGIFGVIYNLINSLIYRLFDKVVAIANYVPSGQLKLLKGQVSSGNVTRSIVVALVFMGVYMISFCFIAEKKDVS